MRSFFSIVNALLLCALCVSHSVQINVKTSQRATEIPLDSFGAHLFNGTHVITQNYSKVYPHTTGNSHYNHGSQSASGGNVQKIPGYRKTFGETSDYDAFLSHQEGQPSHQILHNQMSYNKRTENTFQEEDDEEDSITTTTETVYHQQPHRQSLQRTYTYNQQYQQVGNNQYEQQQHQTGHGYGHKQMNTFGGHQHSSSGSQFHTTGGQQSLQTQHSQPPLTPNQNVFVSSSNNQPKVVYVTRQKKKVQPEAFSKCPSGYTGQLVYELSCNQFLNCWKGRGIVQNCAAGTLFNPETLECDYAEKVRCISGPRLTKPDSTRSERIVENKGCPKNFVGIIPHYKDCAKFINCNDGAEHVMDCPPGTLFDVKSNMCDYPYKSECAFSSLIDVRGTRPGQKPGQVPGQTISHLNLVNVCTTPSSKHAHPSDCSKFVFCSTNLQPNIYNCPSGRFYNPELSICSFYDASQCSNSVIRAHQSYNASQNYNQHGQQGHYVVNNHFDEGTFCVGKSGMHPHPSDCSKYINCVHGQLMIQPCGPGTMFNPVSQICDFPHNVNCSSSSSSSSSSQFSGANTIDTEASASNSGSATTYGFHQQYELHIGYTSNQQLVQFCMGKDGIYAVPFSCTFFIKCSNGVPVIDECPSNTVYNDHLKRCTSNTKCWLNHEQTILTSIETVYTITIQMVQYCKSRDGLYPHPTHCNVYLHCYYSMPFVLTCPESSVFNKQLKTCTAGTKCDQEEVPTNQNSLQIEPKYCQNKKDGSYKHPNNCELYVHCRSGLMKVMKCPTGQLFHPIVKTCDYNVKSNSEQQHTSQDYHLLGVLNETIYTVEASFCASRNGYYLNPYSCQHYIKCLNGLGKVYVCDTGRLFNPKYNMCDPYVICHLFPHYHRYEVTETVSSSQQEVSVNRDQTKNSFCSADGLYAHPKSCRHLVRCKDGNGVVLKCIDGKFFSPSAATCVQNYDCQNGQSGSNIWRPVSGISYGEGQSTPNYGFQTGQNQNVSTYTEIHSVPSTFCSGKNGLHPHPISCEHYIKCTNSKLEVLKCSSGKSFNPQFKICDVGYKCTVSPTNSGNAKHPGYNPGQSGSNYGGQFGSNSEGQYESNFNQQSGTQSGSNYGGQSGSNSGGQSRPNYGWQTGATTTEQSGQTATNHNSNNQITATAYAVSPTFCLGKTGHHPHPGNCDHGVKCQNGVPYIFKCSSGKQFNPKFKVCDANYDCLLPTSSYNGQNYPGHTGSDHAGNSGSSYAGQTHFGSNTNQNSFESSSHTGKALDHNSNSQITSTADAVSATFCLGKTGHHPHPNNCDHGVKCQNGVPYIFKCSSGNQFNPKFKVCDANYDCQLPASSYSGQNYPGHTGSNHAGNSGSSYAGQTHFGSNTNQNSFESSSHTGKVSDHNSNSQITSTAYAVSATFCLGKTGHHPHPNNCDHGVKCQNGVPYIFKCSSGNQFNPKFKVCDANYDCQLSTSSYSGQNYPGHTESNHAGNSGSSYAGHAESGSQKFENFQSAEVKCPPQGTGLYPHPRDCAKFLNCNNGGTFIQDCGPGTHFNPETKVCDWPYKVKCNQQPSQHSHSQNSGQFGHHSAHLEEQEQHHHQHQDQWGQFDIDHHQHQHQWNQFETDHHQHEDQSSQFETGHHHHTNSHTGNEYWNHQHVHNQFYMDEMSEVETSPEYQLEDMGSFDEWDDLFQQSETVYDGFEQNHQHESGNRHPHSNENENENEYQELLQENFDQSIYQETQNKHLHEHQKYEDKQQNFDENFGKYGLKNQDYEQKYFIGSSNQQWTPTTDLSADYVFEYENADMDMDYEDFLAPVGKKQEKSRKKCEEFDYHCTSSECISPVNVCDATKNCKNGLDENDCSSVLTQFSFSANYKLAIKETVKYQHVTVEACAKLCLEAPGFQCKSFNYRTLDGTCFLTSSNVGLCGALIILPTYDYYELKSETIDCSSKFVCSNKKCINHNQVCDGINDCDDRIDEKNCRAQDIGYSVKMAGSKNKHEGRLEVTVFNKTGYVCDDQFTKRSADVVCKELGYPDGALEVKKNSFFTDDLVENGNLYLMSNVMCVGNETSIRDCDFNGWGIHECRDNEIVGVVCKTKKKRGCQDDYWQCDSAKECIPFQFLCDHVPDCSDLSDEGSQHCDAPIELRLADGNTKNEGRVEVRYHGQWGTICDDDFNDDAAKVVCKYFGYKGNSKTMKGGQFGPGEGPIWLDQVFCNGNESAIQECSHLSWGETNCEHGEDVGVVCSDKYEPMEVERNLHEHNPEYSSLPDQCGIRTDRNQVEEANFRVVRGSVASKGEFPWQASVKIRGQSMTSHWCGAVVIASHWVLTAAHCLNGYQKNAYVIVAGDYDVEIPEGTEQEAFIEEFYVHEQFRQQTKMNNDIALVKLKGNGFMLDGHVQAICLPDSSLGDESNTNCTISGFGSTEAGKSGASPKLRAGWVPIQPREVCKMPHVYGEAITEGMLCAGHLNEGVDACDGDSGGPLSCLQNGYYTLLGITSWGQRCGVANKPGVYTRIAFYRDWIDKTMQKYG